MGLAFAWWRRLARGAPKKCNICDHYGKFRAFGHPPRYGAECVNCGSLERHRLLKLWCDQNNDFLRDARVLHFAPERAVSVFIQSRALDYKSADLDGYMADLVLNVENIELPSNIVDLIICVHVIEHVDDTRALAELRRILSEDGVILLMTPIVEGWDETYENPAIVTPKDRTAHFGQWDHLRYYGRDFRDRIERAGFFVKEETAIEPYVQQFGLQRGEKIFVCQKSDPRA